MYIWFVNVTEALQRSVARVRPFGLEAWQLCWFAKHGTP